MFRQLDPAKVVATIASLRDRIRERFPQANLGSVADELHAVAREHAARSSAIQRPQLWLRAFSALLLLFAAGTIVLLLLTVRLRVDDEWQLSDAIQTLEAGVSVLFFFGAGAVFLLTMEQRQKRRRCLDAVHEMRAMAHIVDMHQLTKDPDRLLRRGPDTPSSPVRTLTHFELVRYLDYCSEMLSLIGKVAAIYVQRFPDPAALSAVDDVEDLTTSLARKIWQKIMVLEQASPPPPTVPQSAPPQTP